MAPSVSSTSMRSSSWSSKVADYYDKFGEPIEDVLTWAKLFEDLAYKRIEITRLWHGGRVSTVWLGIDHSFDDGSPLIFETMVFGGRDWGDLDCARYSTFAEAYAGHLTMVDQWRWRALPIWRSMFRAWLRRMRDRAQSYLTLGRKQSNG